MRSVETFISMHEGGQGRVLNHLHALLSTYPEITWKLSYKIPFYYRKSWVCYLSPLKDGGVELAFTRANELSNDQGLLDFRGRKQVAGMVFSDLLDIPEEPLLEIITEALMLDEQVPYPSKRK